MRLFFFRSVYVLGRLKETVELFDFVNLVGLVIFLNNEGFFGEVETVYFKRFLFGFRKLLVEIYGL